MREPGDIVIVGGGPVGSVLALALQQHGIPATLLEAREQGASHRDQRALALSYGTRLILERLEVWRLLEDKAAAINTIHISQKGSLGRSRLRAEEHGQPALGYVLSYGTLCAALDASLEACKGIRIHYGAEVNQIVPGNEAAQLKLTSDGKQSNLPARLAVLADGGRSLGDVPGIKRETKEYGHDALVTKISCELPHNNVAYERFTSLGPVALLPNGERDFSLVWTGKRAYVSELLALDDHDFLDKLHEHFGDRVGRFLSAGKRITFPLKLSYLNPVTAPHLVVIGNAAQTMHPVAGQGFNVGLRDAWELAGIVAGTFAENLGGEAMLKAYRDSRKTDTKRGLMFTDFLVNIFSNDIVGISGLRSAGIGLLDLAKPVKQRLVGKMSFGAQG